MDPILKLPLSVNLGWSHKKN